MADRQVFRFWEADCERYVKKAEHNNWHLWNELASRLKQEFQQVFIAVPYNTHGDWLEQLWFRPQKTPRSSEDWMNQAQLWFNRNKKHQKMYFGIKEKLAR